MLNTDFYSGAVVRLATLQKERGQPAYLLFATVSLLPRNRPLPSTMAKVDPFKIGKTGETVFFRRVVMSTNEAIEWYRALGNGDDKTPTPSKQEEHDSKLDGRKIEVSKLIDDPVWPYLGLPVGDIGFAHPSRLSHPAPFVGSISSRIHRRFGSQNGFDNFLTDDEAVSFVARRLHVDLRAYSEYLGSIALVAPDPVLKQVDNFMIEASVDKGERILYRFIPQPGESLEGLKLTTFDEQANLLTDVSTYDIPEDGVLDIDKGNCIGAYGYAVSHNIHGVLAYSPPSSFMRQMNLSINVASQQSKTVRVPTGASVNSSTMDYSAAQASRLGSHSVIGDPPRVPNVSERINIAESQRDKIVIAKQYGQRWFSEGSRQEAMLFIQSELRRAKSRVWIADPYLTGLQLGQFLYAVNAETTSVILLTSKLAFQSVNKEVSEVEDFSQSLEKLKADVHLEAEVNVLIQPILHDRFMVIDDTVWFLGNSLNALGVKTSLIVKLPNPDEVIEKLKSMLKQAISFEDYKKQKTEK